MQQDKIQFLESQLCKALSVQADTKLQFVVEYDPEEKEEEKSNWDFIMKQFTLKKLIRNTVSLKEACESLVTPVNDIPLWIRIDQSEKPIRLLISKRFRKLKEVQHWHNQKDNPYLPFIVGVENAT
jgi:hypothetical protein